MTWYQRFNLTAAFLALVAGIVLIMWANFEKLERIESLKQCCMQCRP